MTKCPVNGRRARGIVGNQDYLPQVQRLHHTVQVPFLIVGGVWISEWFVRRAPSEEIEGHHSAGCRDKRHKTIIEVEIIWKAVHQNNDRFRASIFTRVDAVLSSRHKVFSEVHLHSTLCDLNIRSRSDQSEHPLRPHALNCTIRMWLPNGSRSPMSVP